MITLTFKPFLVFLGMIFINLYKPNLFMTVPFATPFEVTKNVFFHSQTRQQENTENSQVYNFRT
jgi:hypothetical protein